MNYVSRTVLSLVVLASINCAPNGTTPIGGSFDPNSSPPSSEGPSSQATPVPMTQKRTCQDLYKDVGQCYDTYYDCVETCQDESCQSACTDSYNRCSEYKVSLGSTDAQSQYRDVRVCEDSNYQACYDKGGEVFQNCASNCSDEACQNACGEDATQTFQQCMFDNCKDKYGTCGLLSTPSTETNPDDTNNNPTTPPSTGDNNSSFTCGELYECEDACAGNRSCGQRCYDNGTEEAKSQWTSLVQCGNSRCDGMVVDAQEYKACLQSQCSSLYNTCFGGGGSTTPPGGSTGGSNTASGCGTGYRCVQGCYATANSENEFYSCVDGCYSRMSMQAHTLMEDLVSCSRSTCTANYATVQDYFQCQETQCSTQYNACVSN